MSAGKSAEGASVATSVPTTPDTEAVPGAETTATAKERSAAAEKPAAEKPCAPDGLNAGDLQLQV